MGENNGLSTGDLALLQDNNGFGGNNGFVWFLLIAFLFGGFGGWGGNGAPAQNTQADIQNAINAQTNQLQQQQILLSSANNNYETAQLINGQTNTYLQSHAADQVNMLQGFNSISQTLNTGFDGVNINLMNQTNTLSSKLDQLAYQMDQCCCSLKSQMLQDKYDATQNALNFAQIQAVSAQSNQNLLGTMGKWVANASSST